MQTDFLFPANQLGCRISGVAGSCDWSFRWLADPVCTLLLLMPGKNHFHRKLALDLGLIGALLLVVA